MSRKAATAMRPKTREPEMPSTVKGWTEPASAEGPGGVRHAVRLGPDGRACYFGEAELPGDWRLETIPFDNSPSEIAICCAPDGKPYVACVADNGDLYLAAREGMNDWSVECVGKNAIANEPVAVAAKSDSELSLAFHAWNPAHERSELRIVEYRFKSYRNAMVSPRGNESAGFRRSR